MGELVGVGVPKRPFDCFGHLVGVNCGKSGKGEALGLGRQFWVVRQQLGEQFPPLACHEPVEGRSGPAARPAHCSGHAQPCGRRPGNGGRQSQVR